MQKEYMKTILGVSKKLLPIDGPKKYWCTYLDYDNQPGDYLAIYITGKGICQFFNIDFIDKENNELNCNYRGMLTIRISHIFSVTNPISFKTMASDKVLKDMNVVKRRFQGTTFLIQPNYWNEIIEQIRKNNPNTDYDLNMLKYIKVS